MSLLGGCSSLKELWTPKIEIQYVYVLPAEELLLPCDVLYFGDRSPQDIIFAYKSALGGCNLDKEALRLFYTEQGASSATDTTK